jgi:signal peptidase I
MNEPNQTPETVAEEKPEEIREQSPKAIIWEWGKTLAYAVALALFIRTFFLATYVIPTGSMEPTLHGAMNYGHGDRIIAIKFIYGIRIPFTDIRFLELTEPKRGDIVVFENKGISGYTSKKHLIKRIAGLGGERFQIVPNSIHEDFGGGGVREHKGNVHIDGERIEGPASVAEREYYPAGEYGRREVSIPEDHYFMLGDNVGNSRDSRFWGFLPRNNVVGKAVFIFWPPKRIGRIR